ncbi:MAG: TIGR02281 family clan AA aspartic protease [Rhodobacteraceae bacterium]|nr:TIGR02281 family clan AA aspartic protease [Paracoccaceae bacterium]
MDGDNIGRLFYLVLLGMAVGGWFIAENRQSLGKTARQAAAWGLIFVGVIAGVGLWSDISREVLPTRAIVTGTGQIEVPLANDGHFYLTLRLNDTPVRFMVDTGASAMVLSHQDAERAGLDPDSLSFLGRAQTANGEVKTADVRVDRVTVGGIVDRNVRMSVNGGEMDGSLLGMSYLSRFDKVEIDGRKLVLTR